MHGKNSNFIYATRYLFGFITSRYNDKFGLLLKYLSSIAIVWMRYCNRLVSPMRVIFLNNSYSDKQRALIGNSGKIDSWLKTEENHKTHIYLVLFKSYVPAEWRNGSSNPNTQMILKLNFIMTFTMLQLTLSLLYIYERVGALK